MTPRKIRPLRCQRGGGGRHCGVQPAKTRPLTTNGPHRARRAATAQRNRISPSPPLASQSLPRGSEGPLREGEEMSVFHGVVHLSFSCSYDGRFVLRGARQFPDKADSLPQGFGKDRWELLTASRKLLGLSGVSTTGTSRRIRPFLDQ